jgi:hypothetical protein
MSAAAATPPVPFQTHWIVSRRDDLVWFIGSAVLSYLALALLAAGTPITLIYLIWLVGVDGPHVIATVTRTYFDKQERYKLGWLLWMIVPLMLAGPVMVSLGQASLFYLIAVCWQHFHIAKQHFGFVMLWKAKNKERDATDLRLDRWFLLASTILPLALFVERTRFQLPWVEAAALIAYVVLTAVYVRRQWNKFKVGIPLNTPKLLLLAVLVPLQWLAFAYAASLGPKGIVTAGITLGLFHSFQYHRLMWFHNQNRYSTPDAPGKHGLAVVFGRSFAWYIGAAIGLHFVLIVLPSTIFPAAECIKAGLWGFGFTHYLLDSKIWRVRGDRDLAAALRL